MAHQEDSADAEPSRSRRPFERQAEERAAERAVRAAEAAWITASTNALLGGSLFDLRNARLRVLAARRVLSTIRDRAECEARDVSVE